MSRIMGIDLGTTNSVMAIMDGDKPKIIPNNLGERLTSSVVSFNEDGEILVGKRARKAALLQPERTVASIKRHMGTNFRVQIDDKEYTPQEISAIIIQKMRHDMENYLGEEVPQAVVTVPAYFTDAQRQATRDAGEIAGLNVRRIIDEPTAAAISYGLDKEEDQILMVYDLGGGTFDVSIIEVVSGVFQVLAIKGNNMLGGDDFDQRIIEYLVEVFKEKEGIDLSEDRIALQKLKEAAEEGDRVTCGVKITGEGVELDRPGQELRVAPGQVEGIPLVELGKTLAGMKAGKSAKITATVPEAHPNEDWRGKRSCSLEGRSGQAVDGDLNHHSKKQQLSCSRPPGPARGRSR